MEKEILIPEIKDLIDALHRYLTVYKNNASFVLSFMAFKEGTEKCEDCGEPIEEIDDRGSRIFVYGNKEVLRNMLNELRDTVEDEPEDPEHPNFINI